jgi:putative tryptophan/tyrosine transport system substrate-binding protein
MLGDRYAASLDRRRRMQFDRLKRREFITLIGGAAAAWPLVARAQQPDRARRIGVLMGWSETELERSWLAAFIQGLAQLGWADGSNVRIEPHWANVDIERMRSLAKELVDSRPDVILSGTTPATAALQRETRSIPIVFVVVSDPVGAGFVASLPRPGGNLTGFINIEAAMGGKWLEILKEVAPRVTRAAMMFNPDTAPGGGRYFLDSYEAAARSLRIEAATAPVRSDAEIEAVMNSLAREQAGLIVMTDSFMGVHRATVIALAARNKIPVVYPEPFWARDGGLVGYGPNHHDMFRRAAGSVDRILRGAKPSDLPVQIPTKFDMVINLKTAAALGLTVPSTLLVLADEVIE